MGTLEYKTYRGCEGMILKCGEGKLDVQNTCTILEVISLLVRVGYFLILANDLFHIPI